MTTETTAIELEYPAEFLDDADVELAKYLASLSANEKARYERQETILRIICECGNPYAGCLAARVSIRSHDRWQQMDGLGYRERVRQAERVYGASLDTLAGWRVEHPHGNIGGDTLLIAKNNAWNPDKWRGNNVTVEVSDQLLSYMQKRQAEDAKALPPADTIIEHKPSGDAPPWSG